MEFTEGNSCTTVDAENLASMQGIANEYVEFGVILGETEDESDQKVHGHINILKSDSENVFRHSLEFNLNGQHLILTQTGNEDLDNDLENNGFSMPDEKNEPKCEQNMSRKDLILSSGNSSFTVSSKKSQKLGVDTLGVENYPLYDVDANIAVNNDRNENPCIIIKKDGFGGNVNISVKQRSISVAESHILKYTGNNQTSYSRINEVPKVAGKEFISNNAHINNNSVIALKKEMSFLTRYAACSYKSKAKKTSSDKNKVLIPVLLDDMNDKASENNCHFNLNGLKKSGRGDSIETDRNNRWEPMDLKTSTNENLDSDLAVVKKNANEEYNTDATESKSIKSWGVLKSRSDKRTEKLGDIKPVWENETSKSTETDSQQPLTPYIQLFGIKEKGNSLSNKVLNLECNAVKNNESSNYEETLVKPKKFKGNTIKSESNIRGIRLPSGEENFSGYDKSINDILHSSNSAQPMKLASSSQESSKCEDHLLLSDAKNELSTTCNKKKSVPPLGMRPWNLRPRPGPIELSLNEAKKAFDSDFKNNSFDSNNLKQRLYLDSWGKVLLKTLSQSLDVTYAPSSAFDFQSPKETSTPVFDQQCRTSKRSVKKNTQSANQGFEEARLQCLNPKVSAIQHQDPSPPKKMELFSCSYCNFLCVFVDSLIEHLKYCSNRQSRLEQ